jgi:hypothetical protein
MVPPFSLGTKTAVQAELVGHRRFKECDAAFVAYESRSVHDRDFASRRQLRRVKWRRKGRGRDGYKADLEEVAADSLTAVMERVGFFEIYSDLKNKSRSFQKALPLPEDLLRFWFHCKAVSQDPEVRFSDPHIANEASCAYGALPGLAAGSGMFPAQNAWDQHEKEGYVLSDKYWCDGTLTKKAAADSAANFSFMHDFWKKDKTRDLGPGWWAVHLGAGRWKEYHFKTCVLAWVPCSRSIEATREKLDGRFEIKPGCHMEILPAEGLRPRRNGLGAKWNDMIDDYYAPAMTTVEGVIKGSEGPGAESMFSQLLRAHRDTSDPDRGDDALCFQKASSFLSALGSRQVAGRTVYHPKMHREYTCPSMCEGSALFPGGNAFEFHLHKQSFDPTRWCPYPSCRTLCMQRDNGTHPRVKEQAAKETHAEMSAGLGVDPNGSVRQEQDLEQDRGDADSYLVWHGNSYQAHFEGMDRRPESSSGSRIGGGRAPRAASLGGGGGLYSRKE